jgi:hypothetical protein
MRWERYIYRVNRPERATLELRPFRRHWRIGEIRGIRNAAVAPETKEAVASWLQMHHQR